MPDAEAPAAVRVLIADRGMRTRRLLRYLESTEHAIDVVDVREDTEQAAYVDRLACGERATPVVEVAGLTLLRPTTREVEEALGTRAPRTGVRTVIPD
jgi:hypothetical protein